MDIIKILNELVETGACPALINDDDGHWAVSDDGIQQVPDDSPSTIYTAFIVEKDMWKDSIEEAVEYYLKNIEE